MAKTKTKEETEAYREIRDLFLKKFLKHLPGDSDQDAMDFLDNVFCAGSRTITHYLVSAPFTMPGDLLVQGGRPIIGLGFRTVYRGSVVIVRKDDTLPHCVDVECYVGIGKKEHVYRLSKFEYISIERFLVDLSPYRLEKNGAQINYLANRKKLELAGLRRDEAEKFLEEIGYGPPAPPAKAA